MDVSERRIVKGGKHRSRDLVDIPDGPDLRIHPLYILRLFSCRQVELVAYDHVPFLRVHTLPRQHPLQGLRVGKAAAVLLCPDDVLYHGRPDVGQQPEMHRPEDILQRDDCDVLLRICRREADHVDPLTSQHTAEAVHPHRAVMVSADHHDGRLRGCLRQARQEAVEQLHRLRGGHRLIVNVPGDHHCVRLLFLCRFDDFVQNVFLIFPEIPGEKAQSQVQIRKMKKLHGVLLSGISSPQLSAEILCC